MPSGDLEYFGHGGSQQLMDEHKVSRAMPQLAFSTKKALFEHENPNMEWDPSNKQIDKEYTAKLQSAKKKYTGEYMEWERMNPELAAKEEEKKKKKPAKMRPAAPPSPAAAAAAAPQTAAVMALRVPHNAAKRVIIAATRAYLEALEKDESS